MFSAQGAQYGISIGKQKVLKVTVLTFLVKNGKLKLSGESIFWEYEKKLEVKSRIRSRSRPWI